MKRKTDKAKRRALQVQFRAIQHGVRVDEGCIDREVIEIGPQERVRERWGATGEEEGQKEV